MGLDLDRLLDHLGDGDLDADVVDVVAVVGEDDVDEVLADVVDVALHRGQDDPALAGVVLHLLHVGFEVGHSGLHGLRRLEHERQLHLSCAEELANHLHPAQQVLVDDLQGGDALGHGQVEITREALAVPVDDPVVEAFAHRPTGAVLLLDLLDLHVGEDLEQLLQWVVAVVGVGEGALAAAPVVDEVEGHVALLVGDPTEREDLRRVDDGGVEAHSHALVDEHAVQHVAGRRGQSEAHVGDPERGERTGDLLLDPLDGVLGLHGVAAEVVVPGGEGEGEGVEDQVAGLEAVAVHGEISDSVGHPHLPLDVAGLTLLVDQQADDGRAVLLGQLEDPVESGALVLAVFQVGRVEDGATAHVLQAGLHDLGFGGVQHQRSVGLGREPTGDLDHVGGAVTSDVVDADVEDVGALLDLFAGHRRAGVVVAREHGFAELPGPVGVGALADHQERGVLMETDR